MAYFRCSLGGGGNGAVITVTYGADFYNQTFVATNNVDTVSVVATSSGTVDIDVPSEGSWVISCTIGADTYTSDPVLVDLSYATELISIPNGSTVTPTDDIQTWLFCAGIKDKAYTTLGEVLADEDTYINLLADSNACDYMARSTTWADMTSQTGLVPTMTSATTPSGTVSAGSSYTGLPAWKAFDGDDTTYWAGNTSTSSGNSTTDYIQYQFDTATVIRSVYIGDSAYNNYAVDLTKVVISGSNDGSTWVQLFEDNTTRPSVKWSCSFDNDTAYSYYRATITVKNVSGSSLRLPHVSTLQFYEDAEIPSNADAMRLLGMYDYACDALLSDSTWCTAICNSTYFESVLDVKVPTMTSNTAPSGTASASSVYQSSNTYLAYKAFDGNTGTFWLSNNTSGGSSWLQYEFTSPIRLAKVELYIAKSVTNTTLYLDSITGANDGEPTTLYDTQTAINSSSQATTTIIPITASGSYSKIRLNTSITSAGSYADEVQLYGRHTAQTDIIRSAPSDTIYYMDNGNPITLCTTDTDGIGSVDWSTLPTGDITLYSSVAKNPNDLTADYSKSIKVTKNKVEGWLMPDKFLYWYGYKDALLQDISTANGWSRSGSWTGMTAPTYQTNYVSLKGSSSTTYSGIGSAKSISLSGLSLVINPIALSSANRNGLVSAETTKTLPSGTYPTDSNHAWATTTGIQKLALSPTENNYYPACISATNSQCDLYAMWYE